MVLHSTIIANQFYAAVNMALISKKHLPYLLGILLLAGFIGFASYWFFHARFIENTDNAYIESEISALSPQVAGLVSEVLVENNQRVKKGEVLLRLDNRNYQAKLLQAKAQVASAKANIATLEQQLALQKHVISQNQAALERAKAEQKLSQSDVKRYKKLEKKQQISRQQLQKSETLLEQSNANIRASESALAAAKSTNQVLQAKITQAQSALKSAESVEHFAQLQLEHTNITAPFSGVVGNKHVEPGQFVQPGLQVMALVPLPSVYITANFKETQLAHLAIGQKAQISIDALDDETYKGHIISFSPASGSRFSLLPPENATGNFTKIVQRVPVRIRLDSSPDKLAKLRPGMSVVVDVDTRSLGQRPKTGAGLSDALNAQ